MTTLIKLKNLIGTYNMQVPYENVTKVTRLRRKANKLPSPTEILEEAKAHNFGSTCFLRNYTFDFLLKQNDFQSQLMLSGSNGNQNSHVYIEVNLDNRVYIVDFGLCFDFLGPFDTSGPAVDEFLENQRFKFIPGKGKDDFSIEIHRGGTLQRTFVPSGKPVDEESLRAAIESSMKPTGIFLTNVCIHKTFADGPKGIWNKEMFVNAVPNEAKSFDELEAFVYQELGLKDYPLREAFEFVEANRAQLSTEGHDLPPIF